MYAVVYFFLGHTLVTSFSLVGNISVFLYVIYAVL